MIPIPNHRQLKKKKKKLGFFCIDISVTHGFNYRPRLFESFACTWQWHELCFSFVFGCIFFLLHFFLHSVASLISFTIINSCMLFYILFVCVCDLCLQNIWSTCALAPYSLSFLWVSARTTSLSSPLSSLIPGIAALLVLLSHILLSFLCSLGRQLLQTPEGFDYRPPAI